MNKRLKSLFGALIGGPVGLVGTIATELVSNWQSRQQDNRDLARSVTEFKQEQVRSKDRYNHEWELQALQGSGLWMRRATLALFSWPLFWAYFDPAAVNAYFAVLEQMPDWYLQAYFGMLGAVWGFVELRNWRAGKSRGGQP